MITINENRFNAIKSACVCMGCFAGLTSFIFTSDIVRGTSVLSIVGIYFAAEALYDLYKSKKEVKHD